MERVEKQMEQLGDITSDHRAVQVRTGSRAAHNCVVFVVCTLRSHVWLSAYARAPVALHFHRVLKCLKHTLCTHLQPVEFRVEDFQGLLCSNSTGYTMCAKRVA